MKSHTSHITGKANNIRNIKGSYFLSFYIALLVLVKKKFFLAVVYHREASYSICANMLSPQIPLIHLFWVVDSSNNLLAWPHCSHSGGKKSRPVKSVFFCVCLLIYSFQSDIVIHLG